MGCLPVGADESFMREHIYRGKRIDNGKWVEGHYYADVEDDGDKDAFRKVHYIVVPYGDHYQHIQINPDTVGEFTGLLDKNKKMIFEGDILKAYHFTDCKGNKNYLYHVVEWSDKYSGWEATNSGELNTGTKEGSPQLWCYMKNDFEVAGNIFNNPELLEAK